MSALEEAIQTVSRRADLGRQERCEAAVSLGNWGVFSAAQIATIVELPRSTVARLIGKKDRTGGRLTVESLGYLLVLARLKARGEIDVFAVKAALDAGASRRTASRLTGIAETTLGRHARRAETMTREGVAA